MKLRFASASYAHMRSMVFNNGMAGNHPLKSKNWDDGADEIMNSPPVAGATAKLAQPNMQTAK